MQSSLTCQACQMKQTCSRQKSGQTALWVGALFIALNESIASAMWNLTIPSCSSENVYFCVWDLRTDRWKNKKRKWTEFKVENVCYLIKKSKTTHELWVSQGLLCIKNPLHLPCLFEVINLKSLVWSFQLKQFVLRQLMTIRQFCYCLLLPFPASILKIGFHSF